jgi:hypothetical protein
VDADDDQLLAQQKANVGPLRMEISELLAAKQKQKLLERSPVVSACGAKRPSGQLAVVGGVGSYVTRRLARLAGFPGGR